MEGLAKSAELPKQADKKDNVGKSDADSFAIKYPWSDIPYEVFNHFDIDMFKADDKTINEIRDIYRYIQNELPKDNQSIGDVLIRLSEMRRSLGIPRFHEKAWNKLYNYVRISSNIKELEKQREALRV